LAGGDSGEPSLVPGDPDASPVVRAVAWLDLKMPPKEKDRLSPAQLADLRAWVAAGAPWPAEKEIARLAKGGWSEPPVKGGVTVRTSGGQSEEGTLRTYDPAHPWASPPLPRPP